MKAKDRRPSIARTVYALTLRLYPPSFRHRHEAELLHVFDAGLHQAREAGGAEPFRYAVRIAVDLAVSSVRERLAELHFRSIAAGLPVAVVGIGATYVDFRATEVQATLLVLLHGCFVIGWVRPRQVWRRAVAVAVPLPFAHLIACAFRVESAAGSHPYLSRALILLPAVIAALVGAYAGVFGRFAVCRVT